MRKYIGMYKFSEYLLMYSSLWVLIQSCKKLKALSVIGNILTLFPLPKTFIDLFCFISLSFKFVNSETLSPDE